MDLVGVVLLLSSASRVLQSVDVMTVGLDCGNSGICCYGISVDLSIIQDIDWVFELVDTVPIVVGVVLWIPIVNGGLKFT